MKLLLLYQFFPDFSTREPLLALKNKHGSSLPCSHKYSVRMIGAKIRYLCLRSDIRYIGILIKSICNNTLHDWMLIVHCRLFRDYGWFLDILMVIRNKQIAS